MSKSNIEIRIDAHELIEAVKALPMFTKVVQKWAGWATEINISWAHRFLAKYPSPPSGSTYTRTGLLGRSWQLELRMTTNHVRATLANPTEYAPYVQDEDHQAKVHRGRWPSAQMLLRAPARLFRRKYEAALYHVLMEMSRLLGG